jgi:hypothetical protein
MGRLLSIIAGLWIGWNAPTSVGAMLGEVVLGAFIVTLITTTFFLKAMLRPSADSLAEGILPMPLALYVRTFKAVRSGELQGGDVLWQCVRVFALGSIFIGIVAALTRLARGLFLG